MKLSVLLILWSASLFWILISAGIYGLPAQVYNGDNYRSGADDGGYGHTAGGYGYGAEGVSDSIICYSNASLYGDKEACCMEHHVDPSGKPICVLFENKGEMVKCLWTPMLVFSVLTLFAVIFFISSLGSAGSSQKMSPANRLGRRFADYNQQPVMHRYPRSGCICCISRQTRSAFCCRDGMRPDYMDGLHPHRCVPVLPEYSY